MAPVSGFVGLALALTQAVAAPAALKGGPIKFDSLVIKQVPIQPGILRSGPDAVFRTYKKYGIDVPEAVIKANNAQNSTVAANPEEHDAMYTSPVALGSSGKIVNLDIDTGSADL